MNVLLCSVGRRPYLVEWFKEAQVSTGANGLVIAADADPLAPSQALADAFELAPLAADPDYPSWLLETLEKHDIDLAVSVNDFELSKWAELPEGSAFDALLRLTPELQNIAEDKLQMHRALSAAGVSVPNTWLLSEVLREPDLVADEPELVVKGRYGSGSRGLRFTTPEHLHRVAKEAFRDVTDSVGASVDSFEDAVDLVVVQPRIEGQEYGVDVVNDLQGAFAAVLARRKLKMRFGETDQAISVSIERLESMGRTVSDETNHRGLIDTDCIIDEDGVPWLIDLNPRFGGGYPFSHLAGADVPAAYLRWGAQRAAKAFLEYDEGVRAAKAVEVVRVP